MPIFPLMLFMLVLALAFYDFRERRLPNVITLPLIALAVTWHFPGTLFQWLGTALLFFAWYEHGLGGGDAKLWMALLWLTPPAHAGAALAVMAAVLMGTAVLQLLWRRFRGRPVFGVKSPGAWRTIPFVLWMVLL